jgi:ATP synthase I chain
VADPPPRSRFMRTTGLVCLGVAALAFVVRPSRPEVALGVLGGGVLTGLSIWAIAGLVNQSMEGGETGRMWRVSAVSALVKFFTRHVILALAAYGMMIRLHLDPVGMIVGVTSAVVAAAFEARRR